MSSIVFLGTGGDNFVVGKGMRSAAGIVVQVNATQVHIDPGPGALAGAVACGVNVRENTGLLVSNNSLVRCNDVNVVVGAMTHEGLDAFGVLLTASSVVEGGSDVPPVVRKDVLSSVEKVVLCKPKQKIAVEDVEIHPLPAFGSDVTGVGFKLFTRDFILTYTGDTRYDKSLLDEYERSDVIVFNCCFPAGTKDPELLSSDDVVLILQKLSVKPRLVVITGFGRKMMQANPVYEAREIQKRSGVQVVCASDGMRVDPSSYSANLREKTLNLFG